MPLADLQSALGTLVSAHAAAGSLTPAMKDSLDLLDLSERERGWLRSLPKAPGFKVTCAIQRWWRETRLRGTARLTLAALGPKQAAAVLDQFLSTYPCVSLFFMPEALSFLSFVADAFEHPHLSAIARFEHALLVASEAAANPSQTDLNQVTEIVGFASPPEELLAALLQNHELPEPTDERFLVLVAPHLPHFWQPIA